MIWNNTFMKTERRFSSQTMYPQILLTITSDINCPSAEKPLYHTAKFGTALLKHTKSKRAVRRTKARAKAREGVAKMDDFLIAPNEYRAWPYTLVPLPPSRFLIMKCHGPNNEDGATVCEVSGEGAAHVNRVLERFGATARGVWLRRYVVGVCDTWLKGTTH